MDGRNGSSQSWLLNFFLGDIVEASTNDGLGLPKQLKVAEYYKMGKVAYENRYQRNEVIEEKLREAKQKPTYFRVLNKNIPEFSQPLQVKQIMFTHKDAVHGKDTSGIFTKLFGEGNIFGEDTQSKNWGKMSKEFLHHFYAEPELKKIVLDMHTIAKKYLQEINDNGEISDLADFCARFTMEVTGVTRLGLIHFPEDFMRDFTKTIDKAIIKIGNPKNSMPWPANYLIELTDKYVFGQETLDEIMKPGYAKLAELIKMNEDAIFAYPNWIRDISLKKAWDPKQIKSEDDWQIALGNRDESLSKLLYSLPVLKDAALSLVVGHETSAQSLISAVLFLFDEKHKPVLGKVRQEIQSYLSRNSKDIDDLTKDDLNHFPYLKAIFYESLRLRPPLPKMKGQVSKDVTIDGAVLHKGDNFFLSTIDAQQNEAVYAKPFIFDPERFLEKDDAGALLKDKQKRFIFKEPDPSAFFPFGFNERKCPGRNFTRLEVMFFMTMLLMKNDFVMDDPFCYRTEQGFNLRCAGKVSVKVASLEETLPQATCRRPG